MKSSIRGVVAVVSNDRVAGSQRWQSAAGGRARIGHTGTQLHCPCPRRQGSRPGGLLVRFGWAPRHGGASRAQETSFASTTTVKGCPPARSSYLSTGRLRSTSRALSVPSLTVGRARNEGAGRSAFRFPAIILEI